MSLVSGAALGSNMQRAAANIGVNVHRTSDQNVQLTKLCPRTCATRNQQTGIPGSGKDALTNEGHSAFMQGKMRICAASDLFRKSHQ